MASATEIAQWMVDLIKSRGLEYQEVLVQEIAPRFGSEWEYTNRNGNPAVDPRVLREFKKLHGGTIEWNRSERSWSTST